MLYIGMELILEVISYEKTEKYKSKIADMDDKHIYISYPISLVTNKVVFLPTGSKIYANFVSKDSNSYLFETEVIGRVKKTIPVMVLPYPSPDKLLRIQRREFVRITTSVDIALNFPEPSIKFTSVTTDLSAGGCGLILPSNIRLKNGEFGKIHLVLPMKRGDYTYLTLLCHVVRTIEKDDQHFASLQFLNVLEDEQQTLIRYCFDKQLEYRNKGILA